MENKNDTVSQLFCFIVEQLIVRRKICQFFSFQMKNYEHALQTGWRKHYSVKESSIYKSQAHSQEIPLELISREVVPVFSESGCSDDGFYFTNDTLSSAYYILNPNQRRLLVLLYVHRLKPSDIADMLPHKSKCSIYSDKYRILEELRNYLSIHDN